jgi:hypothetical protein
VQWFCSCYALVTVHVCSSVQEEILQSQAPKRMTSAYSDILATAREEVVALEAKVAAAKQRVDDLNHLLTRANKLAELESAWFPLFQAAKAMTGDDVLGTGTLVLHSMPPSLSHGI